MDAAQTTKKTALFLAVALLMAGAASAQTLTTSLGSNPTVTLSSLGQSQVQLQVQSSDGATAIPFTLTKGSSTWFSVTPISGTTPQQITITLTGSCNSLGNTCTGSTITVNSTAGGTQTITVNGSSTIGGGGGGGSTILTSSVSPISLSTTFVGGIDTRSNISISTSSTSPVSVVTDYTPKNTWLTVFAGNTQVAANQPMSLYVSANSQFLTQNQTYQGSITITPNNNSSQTLTIPVNFTVGTGSGQTGTLTPSQTSLAFGYPNGTQSASLTISSSTGTTQSFNATTNSVNGWLLVNFNYTANGLSTGNTNNLLISLNTGAAANLPTGVYNGTVTLTNTNNSSDITQIPVSLSVNGASGGGAAGAAPTSLVFSYQQGHPPAPPCQIVVVPNSGTYTVTPSGSPLFLYTSAGSEFNGPGNLQVCVAVANLNAGTYSGAVSITSNSGFGFSQSIPVTLNIYSGVVVNATVNNVSGTVTCNFQSGGGCNDATLSVTASDNSALPITVTPSASWITVSGTSTVTPGNFVVHLNPASLSNGVQTGSIVINASGASNSLTVPVVVVVNGGTGGGGTGSLTLSSSSLTFGTSSGNPQTLTVSATSATPFTASTPSSGCGWLQLSPSGSLNTNQTISVSVNPAGLNPGQTYNCNISLVTSAGTQTVGVSYTVPAGNTGNITSDKTSLAFTTQLGVTPTAQTIHITSTSGSAGVGFAVTTPNTTWLTVSPSTGTTPSDVSVNVNPAGLTVGSYPGAVVVTPVGGNPIQIQVTLQVTAATTVSASPTSLTFSYIAGSNNPPSQSITVTGTGQNLPFSATVTSGADWLSVTPATGTAPGTVVASVSPGNLTPNQTYTGQIVIAGTGSATGSTTVNVSLAVTAALPTITSVVNAASGNTGPIAAGEIITIFGTAMGPATPVSAPGSGSNPFPTALGNVQVTVGGYLAPLTYVSNTQINAAVPYEISRPFIANPTVIVRYLNQGSNGFPATQVAAAPGLFTTAGGVGQGAILNANLSVNSAANPANKGDVIVLYMTGEGQTNPAGVTGKITTVSATLPLTPQPVSGAVTVTINGLPATVQFYGEAPGLISGAMQINVVVPPGAVSGDNRIVVKVGDASSQLTAAGQGAVTVAVR